MTTMIPLTTTEYKEVEKEYYNEVLQYDSISVYYNSDYYEVK